MAVCCLLTSAGHARCCRCLCRAAALDHSDPWRPMTWEVSIECFVKLGACTVNSKFITICSFPNLFGSMVESKAWLKNAENEVNRNHTKATRFQTMLLLLRSLSASDFWPGLDWKRTEVPRSSWSCAKGLACLVAFILGDSSWTVLNHVEPMYMILWHIIHQTHMAKTLFVQLVILVGNGIHTFVCWIKLICWEICLIQPSSTVSFPIPARLGPLSSAQSKPYCHEIFAIRLSSAYHES